MQKKFLVTSSNKADVDKLVKKLGISEVTAKILVNRDITDVEIAQKFLDPYHQRYIDPFLMKDMDIAVDRIIKALTIGEKICVYGDYDVDGMAATAILTRALKEFSRRVVAYIPRRVDGYGISEAALKKICERDVKVLISVDCGISNAKEISSVKGKLDVIVTDHHLPALEKITDALAVIDPHQPDCNYPDKNLCGAGIAFKFCQALYKKFSDVDIEDYYADVELAALATIADLVPIKGENRRIVSEGVRKMPVSNCYGLRALLRVSGLEDKIVTTENVAFQIAPRLNSVGRLESANTGLKLLMADNAMVAFQLSERIDEFNRTRKKLEKEIFLQADEKFKLLREKTKGDMWSAVISGDGWNAGLIGLTASKLAEKYNLPSVVITHEGEISRGSCRSIPAFHMKNALDTMSNLFINYGGHSQAAGFSIATKLVPEFKRRFDAYARANLKDEDFVPQINVDALFHPSLVDMKIAEEFKKIEPCGIGNPAPVLACKNVVCSDVKIIGNDKAHLSFEIPAENNLDGAKTIRAVAFGFAHLASLVESSPVNITYHPAIDDWQGEHTVKCFVTNIEPVAGEKIFPTREQLVDIYKFLYKLQKTTRDFDPKTLAEKFNADTNKNFSIYTFLNALEIFKELGLLRVDEANKTFDLPNLPKRNLENSRTFRLIYKGACNGKS